jgi:hypothetical protein
MDCRDLARRVCAHKHGGPVDPVLPRHLTSAERGFVHASDAPRAASSRAIRRAWASEVNRTLRRTRDRDQAFKDGAVLIMAAVDCDAFAAEVVKSGKWSRTGEQLPHAAFTALPQATRDRDANRDGAKDRMVQAILRGRAPGDPEWPCQADGVSARASNVNCSLV